MSFSKCVRPSKSEAHLLGVSGQGDTYSCFLLRSCLSLAVMAWAGYGHTQKEEMWVVLRHSVQGGDIRITKWHLATDFSKFITREVLVDLVSTFWKCPLGRLDHEQSKTMSPTQFRGLNLMAHREGGYCSIVHKWSAQTVRKSWSKPSENNYNPQI